MQDGKPQGASDLAIGSILVNVQQRTVEFVHWLMLLGVELRLFPTGS